MLNGKRPWLKNLYRRYMVVVNSEEGSVNTLTANEIGGNGGTDWVRTSDLALMKPADIPTTTTNPRPSPGRASKFAGELPASLRKNNISECVIARLKFSQSFLNTH